MAARAERASGRPTLRDLRLAVQFLTRVPVGRVEAPADGDLSAASAWFPAVGLLVGGVAVAVRAGLEPLLGVAPATVAAVLATILVTGAFHEDGLADSADGVWGGWTTQRRLEIMRDSRLGTYGVCALVGDLALRTTLLAALPLGDFARAVVAAHVVGRVAPMLLVAWLPPARADGQGVRNGRLGPAGWVVAGGTALVVVVAAAGLWAPLVVAAAAAGVWLVGRVAHRKLGGVTGDILGAGVRVGALLVVAAVVALARAGAW